MKHFLLVLFISLCVAQVVAQTPDEEPRPRVHRTWFTENVAVPSRKAWKRLTDWHFEGRRRLNKEKRIPSFEEIQNNPKWTLLPQAMSVFHDNGKGKPELKFVSTDGREAVFDGDTHELLMDPRFMPTYNYVNPMKASEVDGVGSAARFVGKNIGHFAADVVPYWIGGNVRGNDNDAAQRYVRVQERMSRQRQEIRETRTVVDQEQARVGNAVDMLNAQRQQ